MRPRQSSAPVVTAALVLANLVAYVFERAAVASGDDPCAMYGLVPAHLEPSALVTSMFLHDPDHWLHLAGNVVCLAVFGSLVEQRLGHARLLALYFAAGIVGGLAHVLVQPTATDALVGCSASVCGVIAATAVIHPRSLGFVATYLATQIWYLLSGTAGSVAVDAHVGAFSVVALGFVAVFLARRVRGQRLAFAVS